MSSKNYRLIETGVEILESKQLFPCRIERAIKSTFKIAVKHHKKYTVLSNMLIQAKYENNNTNIWTDFEKSFLMPAQDITVVITTFNKRIFNQETNITIWCRQSALEHIAHAQSTIERAASYVRENYFLLPKLDIIAFWNIEYSSSVSWGLILIR